MTPLWPLYIEPLLEELKPGRVMQIGAGDGETSVRLLQYCARHGARADIIAARPPADLEARLAPFADAYLLHGIQPVKGVLGADQPDLVLLDGEPNWWTVFTVLNHLRRLSAERGRPFPVALVHHTAWPYGRRDMYPNPDPVEETHPFAYLGVDPDQPGLVQDGLNCRYAHATHEGGPHNGVLTAIEDFITSAPLELEFWTLPALHGLGVLAPTSRITPELRHMIDDFSSPEGLAEAVKAASAEAMRLATRLAEAENRLERRTAALKRARDLLADAAALRAQLAAKTGPG